jgi:hypothetical protein
LAVFPFGRPVPPSQNTVGITLPSAGRLVQAVELRGMITLYRLDDLGTLSVAQAREQGGQHAHLGVIPTCVQRRPRLEQTFLLRAQLGW